MKKLLYLTAFVIIAFNTIAQDCRTPVSSVVFQQKFNQLNTIRGDQRKLKFATEFVNHNCLLSYQVKQITEIFHDDYTRLSFAQVAYENTVDKDNFYDVYDAFSYFSVVMRLHDYILYYENPQFGDNKGPHDGHYYYEFPEYDYPEYGDYHDNTRCDNPVSDKVFYMLLRTVIGHKTDEMRVVVAIQVAENNCLTVEQIMKIGSYIRDERARLRFLKDAYVYSYDSRNYRYSKQLLSNDTYRREFDGYLKSQNREHSQPVQVNRPVKDEIIRCTVSDAEMNDIIKSIENQSFNNTQLMTAKQVVKSKKCFTTAQIIRIVEIFSFESSKLEMAKYSYNYCTDKDNYYKVNNTLTFSSSKENLNDYISRHH
jgi:hypothetical protein